VVSLKSSLSFSYDYEFYYRCLGKTLLAKAIANESGINFISVKGPELLNMVLFKFYFSNKILSESLFDEQ
jgi:hypothetical protein